MVRAVASFVDRQRAAEERLGLGQSIRVSEQSSEIAQSVCHRRVFGAKRAPVYLQGPFKEFSRCGQVSHIPQHAAEIVRYRRYF
jgi:hypothetical protein